MAQPGGSEGGAEGIMWGRPTGRKASEGRVGRPRKSQAGPSPNRTMGRFASRATGARVVAATGSPATVCESHGTTKGSEASFCHTQVGVGLV